MSKSDDDKPLTAAEWEAIGKWMLATTPPPKKPLRDRRDGVGRAA
jgi:hypothetical protein